MAATAAAYHNLPVHLWNGRINFPTDTIKLMLLTGHTPALATHDYVNDVSANEIAATGGYTAGGATLASKTITLTAANSFARTWASATAYTKDRIVRPTTGNGYLYRATGAGTSGGSEPTWPTTVGATVTDSGVTWTNIGVAVMIIDAADVTYSSATISATHGALYKDTGTPSTSPLIGLLDFGGTITSTNGTWSGTIDADGLIYMPLAA